MTKRKSVDIVGSIVEMLQPLDSEERRRVVQASLTLLGEKTVQSNTNGGRHQGPDNNNGGVKLPSRVKSWMKQYNLSENDLNQVFHIEDGSAEVIAASMPGKDNKEKTYNSYILTGIAQLLLSGDPKFDDASARKLCQSSGCYIFKNHATYLRKKRNEFTGSKDSGWTLTSPGLRQGAALIKSLSESK